MFDWLSGSSTPSSCPQVSKVGDAAKLIRFAPGASQDLSNVDFEAGILDVAGTCSNVDKGVMVDMTANFVAARGPAATQGRADFQYFVAIVDGNQNIVAREQYASGVPLPGNQARNGVTEHLQETIPLGKNQLAAEYHIYIGFVLTKDEVAYNRAHP